MIRSTEQPATASPAQAGQLARHWPIVAGVLGVIVGLELAARVNMGELPAGLALWMVQAALPMLAAGVWMLAALGIGTLALPLIRGGSAPARAAAVIASGVACQLIALNAIGSLWLPANPIAAWALLVPGLVLAGRWLALRRIAAPPATGSAWPLVLAIPGVVTLLLAAAWAPGSQWSSEFGGYDTLSYHLMLPREWLAIGRLAPLEHNVYSFLPSGMESAYAHLAAMLGAGDRPSNTLGLTGSAPVLAAGMLHALITLAAALATGCVAAVMMLGIRSGRTSPATIGALAAVVYLLVPWTAVVGSSAYNEQAVNLMLAGGLAIVLTRPPRSETSQFPSGLLLGMLGAAAVLAKPTSAFFVVLPIVVVMLVGRPIRAAVSACAIASVVGAFAIAPWLIRNAAASGNPVFPYAAGLFGSGHWSPEQVERWNAGHHFDGTPLEAIAMLASARGFAHEQWSLFAPLVIISAFAAAFSPTIRRGVAVLLAVLAVQIVAWLVFTHLQSRFLLASLVPGSVLIALVASPSRTRLAIVAAGAGLLAILHTEAVYRRQALGPVNLGLAFPVEARHAQGFASSFAAMSASERAEHLDRLTPEAASNLIRSLRDPGALFLLGDATPLYHADPVRYHTTWDASPIAGASSAADAERMLLELGVRTVLLAPGEIDRLQRSGWYEPTVTLPLTRELIERANPERPLLWADEHRVLIQLR